MHRADRRGAVYGARRGDAGRRARKDRRAPERQHPQERYGRRDSRNGDDRTADRRGSRGFDRPFGIPAGGVARRDAGGRGARPGDDRPAVHLDRIERGRLRKALHRGGGRSRRASGRGGHCRRAYGFRLREPRRRGVVRQADPGGMRRGGGGGAPDPGPGVGFRHDLARGRAALHPRNPPSEHGRRRTVAGRGVRPLRGPHAATGSGR